MANLLAGGIGLTITPVDGDTWTAHRDTRTRLPRDDSRRGAAQRSVHRNSSDETLMITRKSRRRSSDHADGTSTGGENGRRRGDIHARALLGGERGTKAS